MAGSQTEEAIGAGLGSIAGVVTFLGAWWYCAATYGFLWGFGFGWVPAALLGAIVAGLTRFLWPLLAIGAVGFGLLAIVELIRQTFGG